MTSALGRQTIAAGIAALGDLAQKLLLARRLCAGLLEQGAIDAVGTSSPSAVDGSFWEFLTHGYTTRHTWNLNAVSVNLDAWNALSEEHQAAIAETAKRMEPEFWQSAQDTDALQLKKLAEHGMVNGNLDDATREELRNRAAPIREAEIQKMGPRAIAVVEAFGKR